MKRLLLALFVLVPGIASAQVTPWPTSTTPPIFGNPSAVDGHGSFSPQLFGPQSCTVPAYAFTGATTSGFGLASSTACVVVGGVPYFNLSANLAQLRNSTTAQRFDVANTWASTISNELFSVDWQTGANTVLVGSRTAATGTGRTAGFIAQSSSGATNFAGMFADRQSTITASGLSAFTVMGIFGSATGGIGSISTANITNSVIGYGTNTATSGTSIAAAVIPTYNQSSGTAANTDFLINRTQTAVGSGAQLLIDAQVSTVPRFTVDTTGSIATTGANGQVFTNIRSLTELTTIAASATTDTTIQMPANSVILGVSVRVTTVIPTAATFTVGDSGSAARFSTAAVSTAATSTDSGTKAGAYYNASALSIRITPNLTPANNTGRVRVTIYYYTVTPPTS